MQPNRYELRFEKSGELSLRKNEEPETMEFVSMLGALAHLRATAPEGSTHVTVFGWDQRLIVDTII